MRRSDLEQNESIPYSTLCIPGAQVHHVRELVAETSPAVGLRSFAMGIEIRGVRSEVAEVADRIAGLRQESSFIPVCIYGSACSYLGEVVERMRRSGVRLVTAESCTGGLVASTITEIPGSSSVVEGGFVVYSNEAKMALGVSSETIESYGAVSRETVETLVRRSLERSVGNTAVAVSGVAGPSGGTPDKPVGTVWIAAGTRGMPVLAKCHRFSGDRRAIRLLSVGAAHAAVLRIAAQLTDP